LGNGNQQDTSRLLRGQAFKLWKRDGTLLKTLSGHDSTVWSVAFSPDGNSLISTSDDQKLILWDVKRILYINF
jgi:WD40 repeat protein